MSKSCPECASPLVTSFEDSEPHCPSYCTPGSDDDVDPRSRVYVRLTDEPVHRTSRHSADTVNVDLDADGVPVGIEIIGAVSAEINGEHVLIAPGMHVCQQCGSPDIQGQPFSGGREYYCPHCDEAFGYEARTEKLPDGALPHVHTGLIEEEVVRDCTFFPNARLSRLGLDAYARCWGAKDWTDFMIRFGVSPQTRSQHTMVLTILATWLPELEARNAEIARLRELWPLNGFGAETNVRQLVENHRAWTQAAHDRAARADLAWELLRGMARKVTKLRRQARVMAGSSERFFRAGLRNRQKLEALQAEVEELRGQRNAAQGEAAKLRKKLTNAESVLNYVEKSQHKDYQRTTALYGDLIRVIETLERVGCQSDSCPGPDEPSDPARTCNACDHLKSLRRKVHRWRTLSIARTPKGECEWCDKSFESGEIARARAEVERLRRSQVPFPPAEKS